VNDSGEGCRSLPLRFVLFLIPVLLLLLEPVLLHIGSLVLLLVLILILTSCASADLLVVRSSAVRTARPLTLAAVLPGSGLHLLLCTQLILRLLLVVDAQLILRVQLILCLQLIAIMQLILRSQLILGSQLVVCAQLIRCPKPIPRAQLVALCAARGRARTSAARATALRQHEDGNGHQEENQNALHECFHDVTSNQI
jgi:hypothetical protein